MLAFRLALVGFRPSSAPRCAGLPPPVDASLLVGRNESTGRETWQGQHATKPHASMPWQTQHSQSRARSVGFVPCLASPCLARAATPSVPWSDLSKLLATLVASSFPGKACQKKDSARAYS